MVERLTYSVAEVAAMLGVSKPTVRRHIDAGRLRSGLVGGRRLIRRDDLDAFLDDQFDGAA